MVRLGPTIVGKVRGTNALIIIFVIIIVIIIIVIIIIFIIIIYNVCT